MGSLIPSSTWQVLKLLHLAANSDSSLKMVMKFPAKELLLPTVFVPTIWSMGICTSPRGYSEYAPFSGIISSKTCKVGFTPRSILD